MTLLKKLLELNPEIKSLDQQPILDFDGKVVGWNSYFLDKNGQAIAGGTSQALETAKRIAIAECFERAIFNRLIDNIFDFPELLLEEAPSTSGFAAGFERDATAYRSICEGLERWAWSQWIDEGYLIPTIQKPQLSELAVALSSNFSKMAFHHISIKTQHSIDCKNLALSIFLGFKNSGIFAGSRVTSSNDNSWDHAVIEAYRNLKNFEITDRNTIDPKSLIGQRANYFGSHATEALAQINAANKSNWPTASLRIHEEIQTGIESVFLFRTLFNDYKHWHLGDERRFVY